MFSYRHAFHAGNHADVLKHTALVAVLRHMTQKAAALTVVDTHAGAGLYRLDGDAARTSAESDQGYLQLLAQFRGANSQQPDSAAPALRDYLDLVASFNPAGGHKIYPGSPFIASRLLRMDDRLKLFEAHPSDARLLVAHVQQLDAGRQVAVLRADGFEGWRQFLPPPSRRALLLCDPSYEIKSDYARVAGLVDEALVRFVTGTYMVWYPIIARPEAHELPKRLKTLATRARKPWLQASLTIKSAKLPAAWANDQKRPGLPGSGVFVINPPHTLRAALEAALPQLVACLGQGGHGHYSVTGS